MDPNSKAATASNAICSSVRSLMSSFGRLELNRRNGNGSINRLPNEMMQLIVGKLDGDVEELMGLRLVSTKWRTIIEDYCRLKKSLIVFMLREDESYVRRYMNESYMPSIEEQFFGTVNSKEFARLFLSTKLSSESLKSLLNFFPNVVRLSIRCNDDTRVREFVVYINSLGSLKLLNLEGPFLPTLFSQPSILSKLEHISLASSNNGEHYGQLVSNLLPSCVRVSFGRGSWLSPLDCDQVLQWHNINQRWLTTLTHLQMRIEGSRNECAQVVHFLSENATSLKLLNLTSDNLVVLTPTVAADLGKLTNLTNLELGHIELGSEFSELEQAAAEYRLTSLTSVLTCQLVCSIDFDHGPRMETDRFIRVISIIFPNLVEFGLCIDNRRVYQDIGPEFQHAIEQHLYQFRNLRKHNINILIEYSYDSDFFD